MSNVDYYKALYTARLSERKKEKERWWLSALLCSYIISLDAKQTSNNNS